MQEADDSHQLSLRAEYWTEIISWSVMVLVLIFIRFLPGNVLENSETYILIGSIISFALIYYLIICRYFSRSQRVWIKDISDIIIISVLIILARDYGVYFFALYFLPIASATLVLGTINSLLIAVIASLFVVFDIFLGSQGFLPQGQELSFGIMQIAFIIFMTIFCRFLALQIRTEKLAREQAEAYARAVEETEKREREFMTMTSHQLLTPLSIIRGFSSLLYQDERKKMTKNQNEYSEQVYKNTVRMVDLVNDLLDISRIRSKDKECELEIFPIEVVVNKVIKNLKPEADKKKIKLEYVKPDVKIPNVQINQCKIEQAIYNLVENSIKYTDRGKVTIYVYVLENDIVISVADTGKGIVKEDYEKVFIPFFRGSNVFEKKGTGLGLYIIKLIIEKHNGKIWFKSEVDKGTTFNISLPIVKNKSLLK